jgi:16S rRNA (guanine966-N2)-methyltransferase
VGSLRISSGSLRGRKVQTPEGEGTRPLLTRVRKSLSDLLRPDLPGSRVLDLFGGSGAIAFELLSNGAKTAVVVELDAAAARLIRENSEALSAEVEVLRMSALDALPRLASGERSFDVVIVAPPYGRGLQQAVLEALEHHWLLAPGAIVVLQRERREPAAVPAPSGRLRLVRTREYGRTVFDFYRPA